MKIIPGDLSDPRLIELIVFHINSARAQTAPGSSHALDTSGLAAPGIELWTLISEDDIAAIGALKTLSSDHGEIKSMHTAGRHRRQGFAGHLLRHLIGRARGLGMTRLSLETGSWAYFEPAHAFYQSHGFELCEPFADYRADPNSLFMTLDLNR